MAEERLWCTACGTVTRDQVCDCNRWFDKGHEMYRDPQFVNYADAMQETAHEQAQEIDKLREQLAEMQYEAGMYQSLYENMKDLCVQLEAKLSASSGDPKQWLNF